MGVHGLTTYLREKKRLLSTTTVLSSSSKNTVPIVVDGWSFIYDLYQSSNLPWVYGGEYIEFVRLVKNVAQSWIRVGLKVYFVFDGACPDLKFPTVISRLAQSHVQPAQLFFRTSSSTRSSGRFLNETRILPPLAYSACIYALESLRSTVEGLELHFADEEGDPYAVELAGRLGGYVVGNDSDFVIFNSEGYRGYIPLDEMVWQTPVTEEPEPINVEDDDFQPVKNAKAKRKPVHNAQNLGGLLPPENTEELTLSFISYSPGTLAQQLKIPVSLLPLFGALVGNDFSKESESNSRKIQALFFERSLSLSQRIDKVAATMHTVISPGSSHRKAKHQVGSVMDLIDRTVSALLARLTTSMGSGEVEQIVEKIVNATLQYAIPKYGGDIAGHEGLWSSSVCALHDAEACSILPMISYNVMRQAEKSDQADPNLLEAREKYLDAYRGGLFSPKTMDILNTGSSWARIFLENPDLETVGRSIGRPIREWIYSILDDTVEAENITTDGNESTDIPNDGESELHRLHLHLKIHRYDDDEATEPPASIIPIVASSEEDRFTILLRILHSDIPEIRHLSPEKTLAVLAVRWVIHAIHARWEETGSKEREKERWSKSEAQAFLSSFTWAFSDDIAVADHLNLLKASPPPPIDDRNIQLTAQVLMALDTIEQLAQTLLLTDRVPGNAHQFSGRAFHALLTGSVASFTPALPGNIWGITEVGLSHAFQQEKAKKAKKAKTEKPASTTPANKGRVNGSRTGLFALLGDMDA
ncbi:hypothetical protein BJ912DRAFT_986797 [Pholiota molesta]|nr:hypothetical protein BJ912DRAFT_986797 [Pholiota molesta]